MAARRVGMDAQCGCGETRPEALIPGSHPTICAECKRKQRGHSTLDNHHVAGEANSPVKIPVPVNDHRARLSVDQYEWPEKTIENLDGSPLLAAAARIRGYTDCNFFLSEKLLSQNPELLELLDAFLVEKCGPQ